jgi:hypothetical protein
MTFLEIKSEKVYSLLAVLLLSGGIAIPVALKRWLPPPTTEPTQPTPLPWWFRHLYSLSNDNSLHSGRSLMAAFQCTGIRS